MPKLHNSNLPATHRSKSSPCPNFNPKRSFTKSSNIRAATFPPLKTPNHLWIQKLLLQEWTHVGPCYCPMIFMATTNTRQLLMSCLPNSAKSSMNVLKKLSTSKASSNDKPFSSSSKKKQKTNALKKFNILMSMPSTTLSPSETSNTKNTKATLYCSTKKTSSKSTINSSMTLNASKKS